MYPVTKRIRHRIFIPLELTDSQLIAILSRMSGLWMEGIFTLCSHLYDIATQACADLWE
jgi:hypothetical protein